jgi:serine/threonine protein kinase
MPALARGAETWFDEPAMAEHGRYSIDRKLAEGGMAEIYLGSQHGAAGFVRPVVVKRIHGIFSQYPQFKNMFIDEAHIAMSLTHSNVVQVLDLGIMGGRYFLILELVDGWDLNRVLARAEAAGLAFPPELALFVTAEVCRALAYAHGKTLAGTPLGIVHRDISPHNILVSEQGEVKLGDFGIATAHSRREKTLAGVVKGKIGFMSPEQASSHPLDARSDIFSLGATLYLMATGQRPFAAPSDLESLLRTQAAEFPAPDVARPGLARPVGDIILRAMQKDPAARYQSAEQMLLEVEQVQRTVLTPAGQTELKRWLAALAARDGEKPISQAPLQPEETPSDSLDGSVIILTDEDLGEPEPPQAAVPTAALRASAAAEAAAVPDAAHAETLSAGTPAVRRAAEDGGATAAAAVAPAPAAPAVAPASTEATPAVPPRRRVARLLVGGLAVVAAGLGLQLWQPWARPPTPAAPVAPRASAPPASRPASAPASPASASAPASAPASADADGDGDIDDDAAPKRPPAEMARVKIVSTPPGAAVKVKRRGFGTTPVTVRFRPGNTYLITLEKTGYAPAQRHVRVTAQKNQVVRVGLKKSKKPWWTF